MLRTNRKKRKPMGLMLTSLLDMFTIILVFLMVSFQAADKDFVLHAGIALPASTVKNPFKTGVNMAVTIDGVLIEGKSIYKLQKGGNVLDSDFENGNIPVVVDAIKKAWSLHRLEKNAESIVVIQADKGLPYRTLHLLMRSAAHAGVFRFRLVVEKE